MSLHIFNSINKSWKMYTHTLSSISGDHLTIKPHDGKNILLEVSANKDIFIKQGDASYNLINLINGIGTSSGIVSGSDVSLSNVDISGTLNPLIANGSSIGLDNRNWNTAYINNVYCETINTQYITQHYTQRFGNSLWNQIGQDISFATPSVLFGISNNGRVVAITEPANSSNRGRLYVYEISFNGTSYSWQTLGLSSEIMVGQTTNTLFGGDGNSVISLSSDGRVVAVSDTLNDASGTDSGQVRVFELSSNIWRQRGQLINGKPIASYRLGYNVALSGNGNILAVSSRTHPSPRNGEIFVYELSGNSWIRLGQDISGVGGANFIDLGFSMSLSLDGTTLAAGYRSSIPSRVEIYRFDRTSRLWVIIGPVNGSTIDQFFGWNIKLSSDGNTIVIGGIGYGTSTGDTINGKGSVSVFKYNSGTSWSQLGQIIYGASANDLFGQWVQISNDGTIISAGGTNSYVRVYKLYSNTWIQIGQVLNGSGIAPNLGLPGHALSGDGTTLFQMVSKSVGNMSRVYGMNRTIDNILSINSDILMISGDTLTNGNINPFNNNGSSLGLPSKTWGNAYIRDLSVDTIEVSGHIMPLRDLSSNLGSSLRRLNTLFIDDLSVNKINGQAFTAIDLTSVSDDIIPATNLFKLGDVSRNWSNAYIRDLSVSSIDVSQNLNPLLNNLSLGLLNRRWANAYIRDVSVSSIDVSGNLNPLTNNFSSLGIISKTWGNAYIRDASVSSIDVSGNLNPLTNNGSSLGLSTRRWGNAYLRDVSVSSIDVSNNLNPLTHNGSSLGLPGKIWGNAYIRDVSAGNIDVSGNLNPLTTNTSSLGLSTRIWGNAYIRDVSVNSIDVSGNLNPLTSNTLTLGLPAIIWNNAYIRDLSVSSIELSGNILPLITNNSNLGSSLNTWKTHFAVDLSVNTINGAAYSAGGGSSSYVITSIGSDISPSLTNTYNLGSTTKYWSNAYIHNLRVSNRAYQEISGDISWSAVNGYYGLAKDAYPRLNPLSSGVKAVQTWRIIPFSNSALQWTTNCWSPELGIFVCISSYSIAISSNGINWSIIANPLYSSSSNAVQWESICWSPQLGIFVACGIAGSSSAPRFMRSTNGIIWINSTFTETVYQHWYSICWSPELGIFVAVGGGSQSNASANIAISTNGVIWQQIFFASIIQLFNVCWSPELKLFVAVGIGIILRSSNGTIWINDQKYLPFRRYARICWSPQLGIFLVGDHSEFNSFHTSTDGINWTNRIVPSSVLNNYPISICWSPQLRIFFIACNNYFQIISNDGITFQVIFISNMSDSNYTNTPSVCWSPELGIFCGATWYGGGVSISSLKGRPPTSYNVFDSSFNSIDETGTWRFVNVATTGTLTVNTTVYNSDDRLKHNEVVIANGLAVIDQLCPKFYQKTQTLLDASYNGDLSGQTWSYEAGLIAQEVLQIPDLSFAVSGGDYYEKVMVSDVSDVRYALSYYEQKTNSDLSFTNGYKEQKINNDLSFTISYYQEKMNSDISFGFDGSYNIQQIINDLSFDVSFHILKMNNDLSFYLSYNEQKINYDLSFELNYSQQLTINDLSRPNYYEVSGNLIKQPYTLNYNSVYIYGLAAIKELHAKVKAQETSLLNRQTIINSLTSRIEALEHNLSS